jgi:hypothetical protein
LEMVTAVAKMSESVDIFFVGEEMPMSVADYDGKIWEWWCATVSSVV